MNAPDHRTRWILAAALVLLLAAVSAQVSGDSSPAYEEWRWSATGSMNEPRYLHTATLLLDGRVLVAGGVSGAGVTASAEVYDPATGVWTAAGAMGTPRYNHTATRLAGGRVLVAGGRTAAGEALASAELFDPGTGQWSAAAEMTSRRAEHAAALLPDGDVLVTGGSDKNDEPAIPSVEWYDPATNTWSPTAPLNKARSSHTATVLLDGRVLVAGGYQPGNVAELYDPTVDGWRYTGGRAVGFPGWNAATRLNDGRVLVTGENAAALYHPASESWTGGYNGWQMAHHAAALMGDGRVMISGGYDSTANFPYVLGYLDVTWVFDPVGSEWNHGGSMTQYRVGHTATRMLDGRVLVAGGEGLGALDSAELYAPFLRPYSVYVPSVVWENSE